MIPHLICLILPLLATATPTTKEAVVAKESAPVKKDEVKKDEVDIAKISEAFGHMIAKNMENIGVHFDIAHVVQGIQDASKGVSSPMSEGECIQAISAAQEAFFKKQAIENLKKAEDFLAQNGKNKEVISVEEGKLQYKIEKKGDGAAVEEHAAPLIQYVGKYLDGTVFGSSKEPEAISLDETIPGITKGLVGMQEGEKRTLYIHPSLAYGTSGPLPPNSMLTFEVEMVKAASAPAKETAAEEKVSDEIAVPSMKTEAIR
jgi:peptidylprolyl isomerase